MISFLAFICSCNLDSEYHQVTEEDKVDEELDLRLSCDYVEIYNFVYNDKSYSDLLLKFVEDSETYRLDIRGEHNLQWLQTNSNLQDLQSYWSKERFSSCNLGTSILALFNATEDLALVLGLDNKIDAVSTTCFYDYGIFFTQLELMDEIDVANEYGCCAGLIAEYHNCQIGAMLEFLDDLGISPNVAWSAGFTVALGALVKGVKGGGWSLATVLASKGFTIGVQYFDFLIDISKCAEPLFDYQDWISQCPGCSCPVMPMCNYNSNGSPLGGYGPFIPDGC